ncbi:MAG: dCTP deaminase domain-containing protein [Sinimarinibacterium flocculans]|uniref:dCTP deaminase domain-containing protein n=1 Tax=Sinimarinibacterium flocculans TaxID=985250 RepID=UPI003C5960FF
MTAMSDASIRAQMKSGNLILDGDETSAKHCSYEFHASRVVYGVSEEELTPTVIELSSPHADSVAMIQPSAVAWIRSKERVRVPVDHVGLWVQTNSLSRRGLLLLNSTLVEPGYEGYLCAHVVNLSSNVVSVGGSTIIAKLLFLALDSNALELVASSRYDKYDEHLDQLAASSSKSFLRVSELVPRLHSKLEETQKAAQLAAAEIEKAKLKAVEEAIQQVRAKVQEEIKAGSDKVSQLGNKWALQLAGGFAVAFVSVMAGVMWLYPQVRAIDLRTEQTIREIVRRETALLTPLQNSTASPVSPNAGTQAPTVAAPGGASASPPAPTP